MIGKGSANLLVASMVIALLVTTLVYLEPVPRVDAASQASSDAWPMYRHDLQRSGDSLSSAPNTNETKWIYNTTKEIDSSPAVVNGRVIVGTSDGDVLALNATSGERLWVYSTGAGQNSIWSGPAVDSGRVFIGTRDNNLYCLDEVTGAFIWKYTTGNEIDSSPAVDNGRVFFSSNDGKVYCLNANDGTPVWSFVTVNSNVDNFASPAILNGTVYVASYNQIFAINASNGAKIWNLTAPQGIFTSSPCIGDGKLFFISGRLCGLDLTTGRLLWNRTTASFRSSPAISGFRLYVCSDDTVLCIDGRTGVTIWSNTPTPGSVIWGSPCVADGKVFVGLDNGKFYCFDQFTGAIIWSCLTLERIVSSPAVYDGTVFVGCGDADVGGRIYAFGTRYSIPTSLTLSLNSQTSLLGFRVNLTGTLKGNGTAIAGASILLSFSVTGGQTWNDITAVPTAADGSYSALWVPSATGTYLVKAAWTPYYPYERGEVSRMLSVNTFDGQNVFSVTSNSTVSALAFNSATKELSFTVTGETGTTGFVDVTVAKSLVANIADLRVYLDGASINYVATSTADSWLLHFTYTHSPHSVVVNLGTTVIPEFPIWTILPGFILSMLFAMIARKKMLEPKSKTPTLTQT